MSLLLSSGSPTPGLKAISRIELEGRAVEGGVLCHHLKGESHGGVPVEMWIGINDSLIRKVRFGGAQIEYQKIVVNEKIDPALFEFSD